MSFPFGKAQTYPLGAYLFVKKDNVIDTKLNIEDALKIIISGGLVSPELLDIE